MENVRGFLRNLMPPSLQEKKNIGSLRKLFPSLRGRALTCYNCSTDKQTLRKAHNAPEFFKNLYSNISGIMTFCCLVYCASRLCGFHTNNEATARSRLIICTPRLFILTFAKQTRCVVVNWIELAQARV